MNEEYIRQLENANEFLQNRVEGLESKLSWQEKTKDLRSLAVEYKKMNKEIYSTNMDKIVNSIFSLDNNSIMDMWRNGFKIMAEIGKCDDTLIKTKRYAICIIGPWSSSRELSHGDDKCCNYEDTCFAISLVLRRSLLRPLISDRCYITMSHNRVCDFSGSIAESVHKVDRSRSKDILDFIKRVNICKYMMNGELASMDCSAIVDTFAKPWTDIPEVSVDRYTGS